jgi:phage baseplate assembly protein W
VNRSIQKGVANASSQLSGAANGTDGGAPSVPNVPNPSVPTDVPHLVRGTRSHAIAFPYSVTELGRTQEANESAHIQQLIHQLLFTSPGERVNRPTFGCDLQRLVFASRRTELGIAIEAMVQGALAQWLGELIKVQSVVVQYGDAAVLVDLRYTEIRSGQNLFVRFQG